MITSLILFVAFVLYIVWWHGKMPWSLSKMHYVFGDWRFVIGTLAYGVPLIFAEPLLIRIAGVGIVLVAAAPAGREKGLEGYLHVAGVWIAILSAGVHLILKGWEVGWPGAAVLWGIVLISIAFAWYALKTRMSSRTAWIEIQLFIFFMAGALLYSGELTML